MDGGGEITAKEAKGLKKGPWTTTEDAILTEYVRKHGEGNWNAVQKSSGLLRCGKSCRLRWANHLRPNLKKGSFSHDEERIIIELHAKMGNKWARMASQLPGRTDNEIKNYWNTRMKRRQRAGLPLYPQEIQHQGIDHNDNEFEFEFSSFPFQNQDHLNHQNMIQYTNSSNTSSSSSSFSSSSSQPPKKLCLDPLIPTNPGLNQIPESPMNFPMYSLYNNSLENDSNQFGFSLNPLSSSSSSNENPNQLLELISDNSDTNMKDIDGMSYSSLLMGDHETRPSYFPLGLDNTVLELPSYPKPTHSVTSSTIRDDGVHLDPPAARNSGLLDALLEESQALSRGRIFKDGPVSSSGLCEDQDKRVEMDFKKRLMDHQNSSHQSSFVIKVQPNLAWNLETNPNLYKRYNEPMTVNATLDDDDDILMSLLNNFPSTTPLPDDWYGTGEIQTEASPSGILIGNHQGNSMVEPHKAQPSSGTVDPLASLGSCYWGNMPSIC